MKEKEIIVKILGKIAHLGWIMTSFILGGFFIGWFIDKLLKSSPIFLVIFIILGITGGMYKTYKIAMEIVENGK